MDASINGGHVTKDIWKHLEQIMQISVGDLISYRLKQIENTCDKAIEERKEVKKENKPLFEEGTLESLLDDIKEQREEIEIIL